VSSRRGAVPVLSSEEGEPQCTDRKQWVISTRLVNRTDIGVVRLARGALQSLPDHSFLHQPRFRDGMDLDRGLCDEVVRHLEELENVDRLRVRFEYVRIPPF
jgi:hypothetical protein